VALLPESSVHVDARGPIELEEARRAAPMASVIEQYVVLGELVEASGR
jgi:hypothetical protein